LGQPSERSLLASAGDSLPNTADEPVVGDGQTGAVDLPTNGRQASDRPRSNNAASSAAINDSAGALEMRQPSTRDNNEVCANSEAGPPATVDDSTQVSAPVVRLLDEYGSQANPSVEAFGVAQQLASQLDDDGVLLDYLLDRDWSTQEHLYALLGGISLFAGESAQSRLRDLALALSHSPKPRERVEGLGMLSIMDNADDPDVRQRLLDVGWEENTSAALLSVADGLNPTLVPPAEREEIVALLTDMARSNSDVEVRESAIHRLGEWERGSDTFNNVVAEALSDNDPAIRTAGIRGLTAQGSLSPGQRLQLLEMAQNLEEHPSVRQSAAEALSLFHLSEHEYQLVTSVLANGIVK